MDWEVYRNMLGKPFNDKERFTKCINIVFNEMDNYVEYLEYNAFQNPRIISISDYTKFCNILGIRKQNYDYSDLHLAIFDALKTKRHEFKDFILYFIAFINSISKESDIEKSQLIKILEKAFNDSGIRFEILKENNDYFIFPGGAKELDDSLIVENLHWLKEYKKTHKLFSQTLLQYSQKENPRDVADNLRKALEQFLQEFFENPKILANNISEVGKFLDEKNVQKDLKNIFTSLLKGYDNANNGIAKHHDNTNENMLEFLLYQTGVFIRTLITLKKS